MKKFRIFCVCFFFLDLGICFYLEWFKEIHSIYILICILAACLLALFGVVILDILEKVKSKGGIITTFCLMLISMGPLSYREISDYKKNLCQDKFGREFNARRKSLGIPQIPENWHIKYNFYHSITWQARDSVTGHESKEIAIDSSCSINREQDEYELKPLHGKARYVRIFYQYASGKTKDSVAAWFGDGDSTRDVSRSQADSILDGEKIKKDY